MTPLTTGIGPHRLERMFNRFAQLASPGSLGFIGFGLAIFLSTISSNAASAQDKANKSTGSASRSSASDAELARLRADTIEKMKQTRAGTEKLLALHEDEVKKLTAEYRQRQELYNQGLISRAELNQTERARAAAMIRVDEDKRWIAETDIAITEASMRDVLLGLPAMAPAQWTWLSTPTAMKDGRFCHIFGRRVSLSLPLEAPFPVRPPEPISISEVPP